jgi:GDP-D-mannose 3',5'-epimerase
MSLTVCVTGTSGFIAAHLARRLKDDGHRVVACDIRKNPYLEESEYCDEFRAADLRVIRECVDAVAGCDRVFHLPTNAKHGTAADGMLDALLMGINVVEASRRSTTVRRFLLGSTTDVYVPGIQSPVETDAWAVPGRPTSVAALAVEEFVTACAAEDSNIDFRIARMHGVYGPMDDSTNLGMFLSKKKKDVPVFDASTYLYVDDCVDALVRVMDFDIDHQVFNVTGTDFVAADEIAPADHPTIEDPNPVPSASRAMKALDWQPKIHFDEGVELARAWAEAEFTEPAPAMPPMPVRGSVSDAAAVASRLSVMAAMTVLRYSASVVGAVREAFEKKIA